MSTPSTSASAPKAERWTAQRVASWLCPSSSVPLPPGVVLYPPGTDAESHRRLAHSLLRLRHDPSPLPLSSGDVPLLP